jgi:hypothetical protein
MVYISGGLSDMYIGSEVPKNHILKDDEIYVKPAVTLYYQEGHSKIYYFDSFEDAKKFYDEITSTDRWQS